jgi:alpha-beta hydrolase superfamily lysophospholipase/predicted GNAT family N-acyltransferase
MSVRVVTGRWEQLGADAGVVRTEVFVKEQGIAAELEWDSWDPRSLHCVAYLEQMPIATGRLLPDGHIGRMAVLAPHRRDGIGGQILTHLVNAARARGDLRLELSAQSYVASFYERHGFIAEGSPYDEVGIPHQKMARQLREPSPIEACEQHRQMPDGTRLLERNWRPSNDPRGAVYLLHGHGEHSGRHEALARWLATRGWWVRSHDHVGHGRSSGARGVIQRDSQLLEHARLQLSAFTDACGSPPILFGQSMGGTLAAELALDPYTRLRGLILSAPALGFRLRLWQRSLSAVMGRIAPAVAVASGLDPAALSHNPQVVADYRSDPLVHSKICARLARWMFASAERSIQDAQRLRIAALLLVPEADQIVDPDGACRFAEQASSALVTLRRYPDLHHEPFNERDEDKACVYADLSGWLEQIAH